MNDVAEQGPYDGQDFPQADFDRVVEYFAGVAGGDSMGVMATLTLAMAAEKLDPILQNMRDRDRVRNMIHQLAKTTNVVTSLAATLGVSLDDAPVLPTADFSRWPAERLARLSTTLVVEASRLTTSAASATAQIAEVQRVADAASLALSEEKQKVERLKGEAETSATYYRQELRDLRETMSKTTDVDEYVVGLYDSTLTSPVAYACSQAALGATKKFADADRFASFVAAQRVRIRLIASIRARQAKSKAARLGVRPMVGAKALVRVLRLSQTVVSFEDAS